jgi:hypothetical protein
MSKARTILPSGAPGTKVALFKDYFIALDTILRVKITTMIKIKKFKKSFFSHIGNIKSKLSRKKLGLAVMSSFIIDL